jgi:CRP-like cAMP-binding protein
MLMIDEARLRALPFFTGFADPVLAALAAGGEERDLSAGELVIEQNDEAREICFLVEGSVEVLLRYEGVGDLFMGSFQEPGSIFGWSALRPPYRYTDSVRCEQPTRLLCLSRASLEAVMLDDPQVGFLLLQRVTGEVARQLEITRGLLGVREPLPQPVPEPAETDF